MLNKAILIGRLTKDPDLRVSPTGVSVTRFSIAIPRKYKKEETDFLNVVAFNKTAQLVEKYFTKGQEILVIGSVQTRSWDGKDGKKNYATEIIAEEVNFVGGKKETSNTSATDDFIPIDDDPDALPF